MNSGALLEEDQNAQSLRAIITMFSVSLVIKEQFVINEGKYANMVFLLKREDLICNLKNFILYLGLACTMAFH